MVSEERNFWRREGCKIQCHRSRLGLWKVSAIKISIKIYYKQWQIKLTAKPNLKIKKKKGNEREALSWRGKCRSPRPPQIFWQFLPRVPCKEALSEVHVCPVCRRRSPQNKCCIVTTHCMRSAFLTMVVWHCDIWGWGGDFEAMGPG